VQKILVNRREVLSARWRLHIRSCLWVARKSLKILIRN
jgi:hypothetical protein